MPGRVEGTPVWFQAVFGSNTGNDGTLAAAVNGEADAAPTRVYAASGHTYGNIPTVQIDFRIKSHRFIASFFV